MWTDKDAEGILRQLATSENSVSENGDLSLPGLAYSLYLKDNEHKSNPYKLAIVAESIEDLKTKIASAKELLKQNPIFIRDIKSIYFSSEPAAKDCKIAFLFPGQGSQKPNMLKDLTAIFPEMSESIQKADKVLKNRIPKLLSEYIYPPSVATAEEEKLHLKELTETNIAQPALGAVEAGLLKIMKLFKIEADMLAGHSLGEYVALYAGGVFEEEVLYELLEYRGTAIKSSGKDGNLGTMLAVGAGADSIKDIVKDINRVYFANLNSPRQTILSGDEKGLDLAGARLKEKGVRSMKINVSCAFHSPYMAPAKDLLFKKLSSLDYKMPAIPIYSNLSAARYPRDKREILSVLSEHLVSPVKFTDEVENMFKDGAKIFLEVGPGNVLTNLVKQILGDREYLAIPCNTKTAPDINQIINILAQLVVEGVQADLSVLYSTP